MLPEVEALLVKLKTSEDNTEAYENGHGYWDDLCLAKFLEGVCLRYVAYPVGLSALHSLLVSLAVTQGPGRRH